MTVFAEEPDSVLARLAVLRAADAPTHGGHVLSYVYDSGLSEIEERRVGKECAIVCRSRWSPYH